MSADTLRLGRLVIAGGSGFLGSALISAARNCYREIIVLTRGEPRQDGNVRFVQWDAKTQGPWLEQVDDAAGWVNLVGRTVDCRKTRENKRVILESRVDSVHALAEAFRRCSTPPPVWVQSATAHIVGDTEDEILDDFTPPGIGFAPDIGRAWEAAFDQAELGDCRRVTLRISFVLGRGGGALKKLAMLARLGLGGTVGGGRQWMSWIHVEDLTAIILRALSDATMHGVYMTTGPQPIINRQFMLELRRAVHRPWTPPAPAAAVRIGCFLMSTDANLALFGRRLVPTRLLQERFVFAQPELKSALADLLSDR